MKTIVPTRIMLGVNALVALICFILVQGNGDIDIFANKIITFVYSPLSYGIFGYSFNKHFNLQNNWILISIFAIMSMLVANVAYFIAYLAGLSYDVRITTFCAIFAVGGIFAFIAIIRRQ